jgi:hypothetical protein
MPRPLHNLLAASIFTNLQRQFDSIANGVGPAAAFSQEIMYMGTTTIEFGNRSYAVHSPDISFQHFNAQYPGVVMEVSYSEKRKDLPHLASNYILGSMASIQAVIGVDLEYTGKKATLTVWRPQIRVNGSGKKRLYAHRALKNQVGLL